MVKYKFTVLTSLKCKMQRQKCIHISGPPSPPTTSRAFFILQDGNSLSIKNNSPSPPPLTTTILLCIPNLSGINSVHPLCVCARHSVVPSSFKLPGSSVHGILQARILGWVDISCCRGSSRPRNRTRVSCTAGGFFTNLSEKPHFLVNFQTKCYELKSSKVVTVYMHKPWPRDSEGTFSQAWDTLSTAEFTLPVPLSPLQPPALSFLQQI